VSLHKEKFMALLIGIVLALAVSLFAHWAGFERDRSFYPVVLLVVASYYELFAVGSARALGLESLAMAVFVAASVVGFRTSLWLVVAALAGHGLFDLVHGGLIADPGVPAWWPMFCMGYDVMAALCLAWLLMRRAIAPRTIVPSRIYSIPALPRAG
jgi:hypothetical protein